MRLSYMYKYSFELCHAEVKKLKRSLYSLDIVPFNSKTWLVWCCLTGSVCKLSFLLVKDPDCAPILNDLYVFKSEINVNECKESWWLPNDIDRVVALYVGIDLLSQTIFKLEDRQVEWRTLKRLTWKCYSCNILNGSFSLSQLWNRGNRGIWMLLIIHSSDTFMSPWHDMCIVTQYFKLIVLYTLHTAGAREI